MVLNSQYYQQCIRVLVTLHFPHWYVLEVMIGVINTIKLYISAYLSLLIIEHISFRCATGFDILSVVKSLQ